MSFCYDSPKRVRRISPAPQASGVITSADHLCMSQGGDERDATDRVADQGRQEEADKGIAPRAYAGDSQIECLYRPGDHMWKMGDSDEVGQYENHPDAGTFRKGQE